MLRPLEEEKNVYIFLFKKISRFLNAAFFIGDVKLLVNSKVCDVKCYSMLHFKIKRVCSYLVLIG
jgi:hypothetical protein